MKTREEIVISTEETLGGKMIFLKIKRKRKEEKKSPKIHCCTRTAGYHRSDDFLSVKRIIRRGYPAHL